ncbi:MAG: hypothetical protein HKN06_04200 [Gammaproteobacteria bacterium]|nr:hypothetical protein [Gammaproteobacteria bacterium]
MSELEDYDAEFYALEKRIGRLAIATGVDLTRPDQVLALRKENYALLGYGDKHTYHLLHELFLLRDYLQAHCISEHGAQECRRLLEHADARLRKRGFHF